jgi:hypothetical protein
MPKDNLFIELKSFRDAMKDGTVAFWPGWGIIPNPPDFILTVMMNDLVYRVAFSKEDLFPKMLINAGTALVNGLEKKLKSEQNKTIQVEEV